MPSVPDFSRQGFRIRQELGANRAGGRITYLATHLRTQHRVVIKQFQFARSSGDWVHYDSIRREIQVLKSLKHPGIPRYLGSFRTEDGFCMVQEYKRAESLASPRSFDPEEVRGIAIAILKILLYLQNQIPPVIHRDIKPANILVDGNQNVYLVDFGFARIGDGQVGVSSVVKGTLGFMPPEQIFNRELTEASDLYGLGMTLICLLTNTPADAVGILVDSNNHVDLKRLLPRLSPRWRKWLEQMVAPRLSDRFANAAAALDAVPKHSLRQPEIKLSHSSLSLTAHERGELLTQMVLVSNSLPDTTLEGFWEVAPHASDPSLPAGEHRWISFSPSRFKSNRLATKIQIDTRQLMAKKRYVRQLRLRSNANPGVHVLELSVQTAPLPLPTRNFPYRLLLLLLGSCWLMGWGILAMLPAMGSLTGALGTLALTFGFGSVIGLKLATWILMEAGMRFGGKSILAMGFLLLLTALLAFATVGTVPVDGFVLAATAGIGIFGGSILGATTGMLIDLLWQRGFKEVFSIAMPTLTAVLGILLGLTQSLGLFHPLLLSGLMGTGAAVTMMLTYLPIQRARLISSYRQTERRLIQP